jgi:hypothetical protein
VLVVKKTSFKGSQFREEERVLYFHHRRTYLVCSDVNKQSSKKS